MQCVSSENIVYEFLLCVLYWLYAFVSLYAQQQAILIEFDRNEIVVIWWSRLPHCRAATSYKIVRSPIEASEHASKQKAKKKPTVKFYDSFFGNSSNWFFTCFTEMLFISSRRNCTHTHHKQASIELWIPTIKHTHTHSNTHMCVCPEIHVLFKLEKVSSFRFPFRMLDYLWMTKILSLRRLTVTTMAQHK